MQLRAAALGLALAAAASVPACEDPAPSRSAESGPPRAAAPAPRPTPSDARPNVLLVTVDTLRADFLGTYGFEADDSPHVDAFAATGVVFERAIAASSATAPAHASIMTSRYTREHSIGYANGGARLTDETRLAQLFREAGYRTGAFVGNAVLAAGTGFETGFDIYDDRLPTPERNRPIVFERLAPDTTRRAIAWASSAPDDEPFFLWVHYQDPHAPYTPPPAYTGRIRLEPRPDERPLPLLDSNSGWGGVPRYGVVADAQLLSEYKSRYAEEILSMDAAFGTLLAAVDSHASGRDAVVLLTADHGEALGEGDRYFVHRHTTTPEVAHVPFVLRAPGLAAGRRRDLVHHVDVLPTLLELAGIGVPEDARGVALGQIGRAHV